jgi:hypothetical protein
MFNQNTDLPTPADNSHLQMKEFVDKFFCQVEEDYWDN